MFIDDLYQSLSQIKQSVVNIRTPKNVDIGDRVLIGDYSSMTYENGKHLEVNNGDYDDFEDGDVFIVIAINQKNIYDACFEKYMQDLTIVQLKSKRYYKITSRHVKLM